MKYQEWSFVDKSTWGEGAWQAEPDKIQFTDECTGLPCLIVRQPSMGHLCGYVGVTEGHCYFGKGYGESLNEQEDTSAESFFDVHGGITFTGFCQEDRKETGICHIVEAGEPEKVWWLGFDCAHCGDLSPGMEARLRPFGSLLPPFPDTGDTYKSVQYVKEQCESLALQLAELQA